MAVTCASTQITGVANIFVDGVTATGSAIVGGQVTVTGYLKNTGTAPSSGNHAVGLYINNTYQGPGIADKIVPSVPAGGQSGAITFVYTVPASYAGSTVSNCIQLK
jgi:subtilase family serine protease